jgi:hypothetical protein|tara:strand:+ start:806 stop:1837 length:1032 start_codon:yes stop_codon:yes gene_type:complete
MKVLLITDQHFGVRNDNQHFINHYRKYYSKVVIPFIKAYGITEIIDLGDTFDKRKSVNFMSLEAAKEMWFDPIKEIGCKMTALIGNHDIYYKNTLRINAPQELLGGYNIDVIDEPTTRNYDGTDILLLPWICDENRDDTFRSITKSTAPVCMGHLELNGFEAHPGHVMNMGMDTNPFSKFERVFTGHYHMKSTKGNISYLGNPYQLYWNDYGCKRGFHVFDTETLKTTFYRNPFDMFYKLYYDNGVRNQIHPSDLEGTFVKLIVEDKGDQTKFDYAVRQLQSWGLADLKIIEDLSVEMGDSLVLETEDTITLLDKYIDEIDLPVDSENVKSIMRSLYVEACEL